MTKNFKAVIETLSEVGYYLAFCFLVVTKTVKIPFKKLASAAEANIKGIGIWLEHAEREAYLARNQSTPLEELIQNLESEILRVTYFALTLVFARYSRKQILRRLLNSLKPMAPIWMTSMP